MKCDLPENDRCYLQTAEGLCYRRRHEIKALDVEGRSKRRRWLARRKAEHDAIEAVRGAAVDVAVEAARIVLEKKATPAVQSKLFSKSVDSVKTRLN